MTGPKGDLAIGPDGRTYADGVPLAAHEAAYKRERIDKRPDTDNWFVAPVVQEWFDAYIDNGEDHKEHAIPGTRFRASDAASCSRKLAYTFAGIEPSDPITVADAWRFNSGTLIHDHVQTMIEKAFPGSQREVKVKLVGLDGSGHMDLEVKRPNADGELITSSVEIKTINLTGFKAMTIGLRKGEPPEGPRWSAVVQAALNAYSMNPVPDEMVLVYLSMENISPGEAERAGIRDEYRRFSAQFTYTAEEFGEIAEAEIARVNGIMKKVDAEGPQSVRRIPDPRFPRNIVVNPGRGMAEIQDGEGRSTGTAFAWQCGYCKFQSQCADDAKVGL